MSEKEILKDVETYFGKKDFKKALKLLEKVLKINPENLLAISYKGLSFYFLKDYKKAIEIFYDVATKRKPKKPNIVWFFLARCYKDQKKYSEAIKYLEKSLQIDPKYQKSLTALEFCYREKKEFENAIRVNKAGAEFYPKIIYFWYWLSYSYFHLKDIRNALTYIFKALRLYPDVVEAKELKKSILKEYKKKNKFNQKFNAIRDMEVSELGFGTLDYEDKGLISLQQIDSLELTRLVMYRLKLSENTIEDISSLDGFTGLYYLELDDNNIKNITGLRQSLILQELKLSNNKIRRIEGLENIGKLRTLDLSRNQLDNMTGLANLIDLRILRLADNQIKKIESINNSSQIFTMNLSDNQIEEIEGIDNLQKLEELNLERNQIRKINSIDKIKGLKRLYLSLNQIEKIEGLEHNINLRILKLDNNSISKIEGLEKLTSLKLLSLANNQIKNIEGLAFPQNLESLYLGNNGITSMKGICKMKKLKMLSLRNNQISTIDNLDLLENLQYLNLQDNPNLPEYFAKYYNNPEKIAKLREYCGMSNEKLHEISKIKLEKEKQRVIKKEMRDKVHKKQAREKQLASEESRFRSYYDTKNNFPKRIEELMKLTQSERCLYCNSKVPEDGNNETTCSNAISHLIYETNDSLPLVGKDRNNYIETKEYVEVSNRRMDAWDRPGTTTVERVTKHYSTEGVGRFSTTLLPTLKGVVCKECSNDFIRKATRILKRLQRRRFKKKHFTDTIWKSMRRCHEDYMKLFESFIEKRGF
ncbi:MAG: leucine-rich repeat domain-containing protein [Candidatus Heimdallarchaeaceae archaeon]